LLYLLGHIPGFYSQIEEPVSLPLFYITFTNTVPQMVRRTFPNAKGTVYPRTGFNWAHVGISRRIVVPTLLQELRRMLKTYPNLWIDLSWVVYPMDVAPNGIPKEEWVAIVEEFPDRVMLGTDKVGHFEDYDEAISKYYVFLDALSPKTARLVARENFLSILPRRVRDRLIEDY
jgi:hypothetical protein